MPRQKKTRVPAPPQADFEWIGGRILMPADIVEGDPRRPEMILWLEEPTGIALGCHIQDPKGPRVAFADTFVEATRKPLAGPPRRPGRIRVAEPQLADELRAAAGGDIEIRVAPTPELDALLEAFLRSTAGAFQDASYFEEGRISEEAVEEMFEAASMLHVMAPWETMEDWQTLRMDIPACDVEGACVSIIGNLGENFGILVFPDEEAYDAFGSSMEEDGEILRPGGGPAGMDFGTSVLSLEFNDFDDLPPTMRREIEAHEWPASESGMHPRVCHRDRDGMPRPLTMRDMQIATACAWTVGTFCLRNEELLDPEAEETEPVSATIGDDDLEVRYTYPYEAYDLFEDDVDVEDEFDAGAVVDARSEPHRRAAKVGRNDPCPCGSGKKYKKCHLDADEDAAPAQHGSEAERRMDDVLVERVLDWSRPRFDKHLRKAVREFHDPEGAPQLFIAWLLYCVEVEGSSLAAHFLDDPAVRLAPDERRWLEAQRDAWISVWEVQAVEAGKSLDLLDLLSGERRHIVERTASRQLVRREALLGRVVRCDEGDLLYDLHPHALPPREAAEVVAQVRAKARMRGDIPPARLRTASIARHLIRHWAEAVEEYDRERAVPPQLQNTDGEALKLTVDRYEFDATRREQIAAALAGIEGIDREEGGAGGTTRFAASKSGNAMHANWDNTIVASLRLGKNRLEIETNSTRRADDMRRRVEAACGSLLRNRKRSEKPGAAIFERATRARPAKREAAEKPPELARIARQFKEKHYEAWIDEPLPALGGKTPREAARLVRGRADLEVLLKDMEHHEARLPAAERFDFGRIRAQLGL